MNSKTKDRYMFILGVAICFGVAGLSVFLEKIIPGELLGASIIALFLGTIINSFFHPSWMKPALKFTSKRILKVAIILLGASLSINTIMSVGKMTFFVMIFTFAMCFGGGYFIRKLFGLNWKLGNLISAGTGICGGSAIAAISPVIDAEDKDIAFAMSSTFIFDMVMVALYPIMGKLLGMTDIAYGIWAGTSVNDTASVVASGYAFSEIAGDFATMVKLTRTIAIIPTVLVFAYIGTRIKQKELKEANKGQKVNLIKIIPWFIGGFLLLAVLNSVGCIPVAVGGVIKNTSKFLMVTAAEIGVRESRMIVGDYVLSESDCRACTKFEDAIAACNYDIDIHNPEGSGTSHYYFPEGEYYTIPYRSLIPQKADNMLVAGRCISSDHGAQASYRIMPTVCCIGEAAGTAVGIAVKEKVTVRNIDIQKLQQTLKNNNAFIGI